MKAVVYEKYGPPEVLELTEVATPSPKADEVLVKIHAASVNSWDWDLVRGKPRVYRLLFGLLSPRHQIIGSDIAGRVEAVGGKVQAFRPGDEVFGDISGSGFGAFAEYVAVPEHLLARKPVTTSFEEAAALPQAGVLALQGLGQKELRPGDHVLINGAGGGAGTFAIQLAKASGAEVTGVDSREKLDLMRSLGVDHVMDYRQHDFTRTGQRYDLILDMVADRSISAYRRALARRGKLVVVGGSPALLLKIGLIGSWIAHPQKMSLLVHKPNKEDLNTLAGLYESGTVKPVIDKQFPLDEVPEALRYIGNGGVKGKIVINVSSR